MNALRVAYLTSLRAQLALGRFLLLAIGTLGLLLFVLLPVPGAGGDLFASRVELLRACLLFPGILVALELRRSWPALGPEDEAQVWLHLTGTPAWLPRVGALLGGLCALLTLFVFEALLLGLGLILIPDRPGFQQALALTLAAGPGQRSFLVQPDDSEIFTVKTTTQPGQSLFLRPWSMGSHDGIAVEILAAERDGDWRSLGRTLFRSPGDHQRFALAQPLGAGSRIRFRRQSPPGTIISLDLGEILILGPALGPLATSFRAALPYLPWALLMLLAALSLTALLSPGLWGLAVLCLLPTIGMTPGFVEDHTGAHLGQGFSSLPELPGAPVALLAVALLAVGLLWPRRIRTRELAS